jgi:type VI secretion system protein ImpK
MIDDSDKTFFGGNPRGPNERTVVVPTPGRRPSPAQAAPAAAQPAAGFAAAPPTATGSMELQQGLNPLMASASELVALLGELRHTVRVQNPNQLRTQVVTAIKQFENTANSKGVPSDVILSARYILCTAIDEAVLNTPWGSEVGWSRASLLSTFHNETFGGEKVFMILERLQGAPAKYLDLIELIYVCLSLGFEGKYKLDPRGRDQLEIIRDNLSRIIATQRGDFDRDLSPRWQGASQQSGRIMEYIPMWVIAAVVVALLLVSYSGYRVWLETVTDPQEQNLLELIDKYQP